MSALFDRNTHEARARHEWVSSCDFHPITDGEVLKLIQEKVHQALAEGVAPVVLLDLDSTLYEVGPRSHSIWREAAEKLASRLPVDLREALGAIAEGAVGYSIHDTLRNLGFPSGHPHTEAHGDLLREFWRARFFSNEYLVHDRPYPGTPEFVKALYELGAHVVYLTGRDAPGMQIGTIKNLHRDGFPIEQPRTRLIMKAAREIDDFTYKVGAAKEVAAEGRLVASLENEPRNLAGIYEMFPEALHVFVETVCSDHPAPSCQGIYRVRAFC